jgi:carboxypeptidase PM20D1
MESTLKTLYPQAEVVPILFPASSDNNYFRACQIPTFGILPAILTKAETTASHNTNEHIRVHTLHKGVEAYTLFLQKISTL